MWSRSQLSYAIVRTQIHSAAPKKGKSNRDKFMAGFGPGLSSAHLSVLLRVESLGQCPRSQ